MTFFSLALYCCQTNNIQGESATAIESVFCFLGNGCIWPWACYVYVQSCKPDSKINFLLLIFWINRAKYSIFNLPPFLYCFLFVSLRNGGFIYLNVIIPVFFSWQRKIDSETRDGAAQERDTSGWTSGVTYDTNIGVVTRREKERETPPRRIIGWNRAANVTQFYCFQQVYLKWLAGAIFNVVP